LSPQNETDRSAYISPTSRYSDSLKETAKMKKLAAMIALALTTAFAVPAIAQGVAPVAKVTKSKASQPKVQNMKFDAMEMEGTIGGPDGLNSTATNGAKFKHFKLVRTSFYDKLVRSTENL
jgi:F0F1-type ATP synthase membrane subunit c/vacuolar-type H+-ATPase subunit K